MAFPNRGGVPIVGGMTADPIGFQGAIDPIAGAGMLPPLLNDPAALAQPATGVPDGMALPPSVIGEPTMSQKLIAAGLAMIAADKAGMGGVGSLAAGLQAYNAQLVNGAEEARKDRKERLAEYDLLARIKERQNAEIAAAKRVTMLERLKKQNPEMADLIDLDPEAAAKAIAANMTPAQPFGGTAMDAQVANILLQGNPATPEYLAAYNMAKQKKIMPDGTEIMPDMSAYRVPVFNPAGAVAGTSAAIDPATGAAYGSTGGVSVGTAKSQVPELEVIEGMTPNDQDAKSVKAIMAAHDRLDKLFAEREKLIGDKPPVVGSQEALLIDQNFGQIAAEIKDLKQMGAYDQGVENLARGIVGDPVNRGIDPMSPFSSTSKMMAQNKGGKEFAKQSLESARNWVKETRDSELKARGYRLKGSATPVEPTLTGGAAAAPAGQPSQADIEFTAKKHGMTVEQVKQRLGIK